jgi:hypothetical protein
MRSPRRGGYSAARGVTPIRGDLLLRRGSLADGTSAAYWTLAQWAPRAAVGSSFIDASKSLRRSLAAPELPDALEGRDASELSLAEVNRCTLTVPSPLFSLVDASGVVTSVIMACPAPISVRHAARGALATPT